MTYYSAGTYEAFAHPEKPKDVDKNLVNIIGTGLAGLTAAFYLVRDGQMKGKHIHLLEKLELSGGSCDGRGCDKRLLHAREPPVKWITTSRSCGYLPTRSSMKPREYSAWTSITGLISTTRTILFAAPTVNRGEDAHTDKKFLLDKNSTMALSKLFLTPEKDLENKKISDVLPASLLEYKFLALLADNVCLSTLVECFRNEALSLPLCASY